jgi:osmotically-inducible protein OsmY
MKSDLQLKADVTAELAWDPAIDARQVGVAVQDGLVTVSGVVDNYLCKHAIERALHRVGGVRGIALELQVRLPPAQERSDAEIAEAALHALAWHALVPQHAVQVQVDHGWVTLTGEVDWGYQSASAEQCVHPLVGVRAVTNRIRLKQRADPVQLRAQIAAAFLRRARREAGHLAIDVDGGVVTLSGSVHSMAEHQAALGVAYATKGVTRVVDQLQVA